ncbi:hypothetical protein [Mesorhizobium sp.]|uniref:hypothetical protein n=1 Tax=Mesorhizobium sp. TaxID=1871066 RepID=UPI000FE49CFD|nr:hypothetical protein [Mesorhizobium sp.]RWP68175.1 MAG: hypothetical protein EOR07_08145 [Mesorhizobium sp.]
MSGETNNLFTYSQFILAAATAVTSVALAWITYILAKHTKRMADNTSTPHIVVTIEPNRWSIIHFDLIVSNTGNATAYDIKIAFNPPLPSADARRELSMPLQNLSVLRPGHQISSYLAEYSKLKDQAYSVTVTWKFSPKSRDDSSSYLLNISDYDAITRLGAVEPSVQIAEQLKKFRDDWTHIATGHRRINVDIYTQSDRANIAKQRKLQLEQARASRSDKGEG